MSFVIKFHFNGEVRRVSVPKPSEGSFLPYDRLKNLIVDLGIALPNETKRYVLQWQDEEGEVITIGSDYEVKEAMEVMTAGGGNTLRFIVKEEAVVKVSRSSSPTGASSPAASCPIPSNPLEAVAAALTAGVGGFVQENFARFQLQQQQQQQRQQQQSKTTPVPGASVVPAATSTASSTAATPAAPVKAPVVHEHVQCDECGMLPITGIRYKCSVREDFDLCEKCEAKKIQPYAMLKIAEPTQAPTALLCAYRGREESDDEHAGEGGGEEGADVVDDEAIAAAMAAEEVASTAATGSGSPWQWQRGAQPPLSHPYAQGHGHGRGAKGPHHGGRGAGFMGFKPHPHPHHRVGGGHPHPHHPPHHHHHVRHGPHHVPPPHGHPHGPPPHLPPPPHAPAGHPHHLPPHARGPPPPHAHAHPQGGRVATWNPVECQSKFVNAMDRFLFGDEAVVNAKKDDTDSVLQQAIAESLQFNSFTTDADEPVTTATKPVHVETIASANPALPKPALRFVRDVTFPDKSSVAPGSLFRKIWRVRNDGAMTWPTGCTLIPAGGDLLTSEHYEQVLPSLAPNEESDIAVDLSAPLAEGLFTAYFRARTKESQNFGHRLWASVVVDPRIAQGEVVEMDDKDEVEREKEQYLLSTSTCAGSAGVSSSHTEVEEDVAAEAEAEVEVVPDVAPVVAEVSIEGEADWDVVEQVLSLSNNSSPTTETPVATEPVVPEAAANNNNVFVEDVEVDVAPQHTMEREPEPELVIEERTTTVPASVLTPTSTLEMSQSQSFRYMWRKELEMIADMGFNSNDLTTVAPLLLQYLHTPSSISSPRDGPNPEGMQQVITALLHA